MEYCVKNLPELGNVLWMTHQGTEIGASLDYGIRLVHLSRTGMEELFYRQPADLSDGFYEDNGWRLRGGHRLWTAPEDNLCYLPDNDPVQWTAEGDTVTLRQKETGGVVKALTLTFLPDGAVRVYHSVQNVSDGPMAFSSWGISTLEGGGTARVPFAGPKTRDLCHGRVLSLWSDTSLTDPRLTLEKESLTVRHTPIRDYFKIGVYCAAGQVVMENRGQRLTLRFGVEPMAGYPDGGCNFELYMCSRFMELETLSTARRLLPGQTVSHEELWKLETL